MAEHTRGQWVREGAFDIWSAPCMDEGAFEIASVNWADTVPEGEAFANAHLIAAAPDLLNALENLLDCYDELDCLNPDIIESARASIAKATGEGRSHEL